MSFVERFTYEGLASNLAAKGENVTWIQLLRLSQQFPEIWEFESMEV